MRIRPSADGGAAPRSYRRFSLRAVIVAASWLGVVIGVFVIWPNAYVLIAGAAPVIFFTPTTNSMIIAYRTAVVPDRLQGRVTSVARSLALLGLPLGPLVAAAFAAAAVGDVTTVAWVLLAHITVCVGVLAVCAARIAGVPARGLAAALSPIPRDVRASAN